MTYFISIDVEDEGVKESLNSFTEKIRKYGDMNPVEPGNYHITLLFLGEIAEENKDEVIQKFIASCESIDVETFTCNIKNVGVFPHMKDIKTIFSGVEPGENCNKLHMNFNEVIPSENEHEYVPHVTLARLKSIPPEQKDALRREIRTNERDFGTISVEHVRLKQSERTPQGPVYTDIAVCEL